MKIRDVPKAAGDLELRDVGKFVLFLGCAAAGVGLAWVSVESWRWPAVTGVWVFLVLWSIWSELFKKPSKGTESDREPPARSPDSEEIFRQHEEALRAMRFRK